MTEPNAFSKSRYWNCKYSTASACKDSLAEAYDCENQGIINMSLHLGKFLLYKVRQPGRTFKMVARICHVQPEDTPRTVDKSLDEICANCQFYQSKPDKTE